jgi:HTH-type transcriptional regulator/antitoxin HigA
METMKITPADADDIAEHFGAISSRIPLRAIKTQRDHKIAVAALNALLDAGGADEAHPLAALVGTLGELIGDYEDARSPAAELSPADMLRFLMDQHGLSQSDLPDVGSQGVVSEILNGKRELNVRQIRRLAEQFRVGTHVFI